jgi:hypothetical protein
VAVMDVMASKPSRIETVIKAAGTLLTRLLTRTLTRTLIGRRR